MPKAQVQEVGGTMMLEVPPSVVEDLQLAPGAVVDLSVEGTGLMLRGSRPKYTLDELLSRCGPDAFERTEEDRAWLESPPVGRELL